MTRLRPLRTAAVSLSLLAAGIVTAGAGRAPRSPDLLLEQVMAAVGSRFYAAGGDSVDVHVRAARGLVRELGDPYSALLSPKDLERFDQETLGRYAGVGMQLVGVGDSTVVEEVYPGTPSQRAGFRRGDRVVRVGDRTTARLTVGKVSELLRGATGSAVAVAVARPGEAAPIVATLARAVVRLPSVPFTLMLDGHIVYVPLTGFPETAGAEVAAALHAARLVGARGVILDVRGNPGGAVDQAVDVANVFLASGRPVVEVRERDRVYALATASAPVSADIPLVVLQDGGTASAAEIVAGALQDHDRALVVGATSFGKGIAQSLIPLDGGYVLKLTTSHWFTPRGRSIHLARTHADSAQGAARAPASDSGSAAERPLVDGEPGEESRPVFSTAGGRRVHGGGGIVPDVRVAADTLTDAERALRAELVGATGAPTGEVLSRYALDLAGEGVPRSFAVAPAWRDELFRRLTAAGVRVTRPTYDAAPRYVELLLEQRVARLAFGAAEARRRELAADTQFRVAYELLRRAPTQAALLELGAAQAAVAVVPG
jgi:carboxyl-terminal processing protease